MVARKINEWIVGFEHILSKLSVLRLKWRHWNDIIGRSQVKTKHLSQNPSNQHEFTHWTHTWLPHKNTFHDSRSLSS